MKDAAINLSTITGRINAKALDLLGQYPDGLQWFDLVSKIITSDPSFHPKTVNGCVWKLVEKFPNTVYKPAKGLFCLRKNGNDISEKFHKPNLESANRVDSVNDYIANIPNAAQASFKRLREIVQQQLPMATEVLSYGVIGYKIDDKRARVFISGWKDHVAMYPIPDNEVFRQELEPYIRGKGTLWFSLDKPLPIDIIKESVRLLIM